MEYNDNTQQPDIDKAQQQERFQNPGQASIPAPPISAVLHRLGLHSTAHPDEIQADQLLHDLNSADWSVRATAIYVLGKQGGQTDLLVRALSDEHVAVRTAAIQALEKQGEPVAIEPLLSVLRHEPVWSVRALAALALRMNGEHVPIAPLLDALHDEDESVRAATVHVLGTMGEHVPLHTLEDALHDPSWSVREAAVLSLKELGQRVPAALLLLATYDGDAPIRETARTVLEQPYPATAPTPVPLTTSEVNPSHKQEQLEVLAHEPGLNGRNQQQPHPKPRVNDHNSPMPYVRRQRHPFFAHRKISRRAMMVGVAAVIVAGNSIIWSLLLRGLRDRQKPRQTTTGTSKSISFYGPGYSALDTLGNLYVMDEDLQNTRARILKLSPAGNVLTQWHFQTSTQPTCLTIDGQGNPYVSVQGTKDVYQLLPTGNLRLKWRLTGQQPTGLTFDAQGNLYVAFYDNDTIQKYSSAGKLLATWGGPGTNPGQFYNPTTVAIDGQGNIYVADSGNNRIQKLTPTGTPIATWGTPGNGPGQFLQLGAIALDSHNNIYTTDADTGLVQKFSSAGKLLEAWGANIPGTMQFGVPRGIAVDTLGNIYVSSADSNGTTLTNGRITILSPTGKLVAIWR